MSLINEENKTRFFTSFQSLVDYLLENSGIQEEDLPPILNSFLTSNKATASDVENQTNLNQVLTVATGDAVARRAIEEWVQLAPESLNTLEELSAAFQNDPDIIQKLFDLLATKADKSAVDDLRLFSNVKFNSADWDEFLTWGAAGLQSKASGIYHGQGTAKRLGITQFYDSETYTDMREEEPCDVTIKVTVLQSKVFVLEPAHFVGADVRLAVTHLNQMSKSTIYKSAADTDIVQKINPEDINDENESFVTISNQDWLEGDRIVIVFDTYVEMGLVKTILVNAETSAAGCDFFRTVKVINGSIVTTDRMVSNVWRSNSLDLDLTIDSLIEAINEAIPDEPAS